MIRRIQKITLAVFLAGSCLIAVAGCSHNAAVTATAQKEMSATPAARAQETQAAVQRIGQAQNMPPQVRASLIASQTHQQHP